MDIPNIESVMNQLKVLSAKGISPIIGVTDFCCMQCLFVPTMKTPAAPENPAMVAIAVAVAL